jgi:lipid-A-disaccharide synthase
MIRVRYVALPNLLFGKEIVKEFIQENCDPEAMAGEVLKLLDLDQKHSTVNTFRQIHLSLRRGASSTAADAILELSRA